MSDAKPVVVGISAFSMTPSLMTGTAAYLRGLLRELAMQDGAVEPVVLINRLMDGPVRAWSDALRVHPLHTIPLRDSPMRRLALLGHALAFRSLVARQIPPDLQIMHYPLTLPVPRTDLPVVLTLHDLQHHDLPTFFSAAQLRWRRYAYDDAARAASMVITVSEHAKQRIVDCLGIEPERVTVILNGVDHSLFGVEGEDDHELLAQLSLPERFLLYPAGLWPHKNHRRLIDALTLIEDHELALVLTGPTFGSLPAVMEHARTRGVYERVRHLGYVAPAQLAALYRRATAMVFPSLYEGFGLPPLEAMACGCPVAASLEGSLAEVCSDHVVSFEPGESEDMARAIDSVVADASLRRGLREDGLAWSARFTWRRNADEHIAIYRDVARAVEDR